MVLIIYVCLYRHCKLTLITVGSGPSIETLTLVGPRGVRTATVDARVIGTFIDVYIEINKRCVNVIYLTFYQINIKFIQCQLYTFQLLYQPPPLFFKKKKFTIPKLSSTFFKN